MTGSWAVLDRTVLKSSEAGHRAMVSLRRYDNTWYHPGRGLFTRTLWFCAGLPILRCASLPGSGWRVALLRLFGAQIGSGARIKPGFRVKYPWRLTVGDDCWLGEDAWIDNLADVVAGDSVCISQGAYLCTGNHDWSDPAFGLITKEIHLGNSSWVGARATIGPGATLGEGSVAAAGSVVTGSIPPWEIHGGNPAKCLRLRTLREFAPGNMACFPNDATVEPARPDRF